MKKGMTAMFAVKLVMGAILIVASMWGLYYLSDNLFSVPRDRYVVEVQKFAHELERLEPAEEYAEQTGLTDVTLGLFAKDSPDAPFLCGGRACLCVFKGDDRVIAQSCEYLSFVGDTCGGHSCIVETSFASKSKEAILVCKSAQHQLTIGVAGVDSC